MPVGLGAHNNIWHDPNSTYGAGQNWRQTPFTLDYMDPQVPRGVWTDWLTRQGMGGYDRRSTFANSQYGRMQDNYQAAVRNKPGLTWRNYLNQNIHNMKNQYLDLAPSQRGENQGMFSGRTRVVGLG